MDSFEAFCAQPNVLSHGTLPNGDTYGVMRLAFHVALYINPESDGGSIWYDERYCYRNPSVVQAAIEKFKECGEWRYWQKDHKRQLSVHENELYPSGQPPIKSLLVRTLEWDLRDVDKGIFK